MASEHKPKNKGTARLFKNPVLEALTRTHTAVPVTMFMVFGAVLIYFGLTTYGLSVPQTITLFVTGFFGFTLLEYIMHRFLYHGTPKSEKTERFYYTIHGVHHEFPKDRSRLAMPPLLSALLGGILFGLFYLAMGVYVYAFLPGFLAGYSTYLFIHFAIHAFKPPKNFFKTLWVNHSIHHYKEPDRLFGVTFPLWDYVFRTTARVKAGKR